MSPPAVHVPDARRRSRARRAPGPSPDLVRRRAPRVRVPRGRLPIGLRGRGRWSAARSRRRPHEVAPPRGHGPPSAVAPVRLRARARRLVRRARPRRAGRARPPARGCSAATAEPRRVPRPRSPAGPRPTTCDGDPRHLRGEGEDPDGWRITLITNLRVSVTSSTRPASTCAATRRASCASSSSRSTTRTGSGTSTRSGTRGRGGRPFAAAMDKAFFVSPFIEKAGGYAVHVRDERRRRAHRDRAAPGRSAAAEHKPRAAARAADGPDRCCGCSLRHPLMTQRRSD